MVLIGGHIEHVGVDSFAREKRVRAQGGSQERGGDMQLDA